MRNVLLSVFAASLVCVSGASAEHSPECEEAKLVWEAALNQFHETKEQILADYHAGLIDADTKHALMEAAEADKAAAEAIKDSACKVEEDLDKCENNTAVLAAQNTKLKKRIRSFKRRSIR